MPRSASDDSTSCSRSVSAADNPLAGSSSSSTCGSVHSARASSTSRDSPVGSDPAGRSARWAMPTRSRFFSTCARTSGLSGWRSENRSRQIRFVDRPSTATWRFSKTDSPPNSSRIWKVRAMPARARRSGVIPLRSRPSSSTCPESGGAMPLMLWNSVVLPAPFGPMSEVTCPGSAIRARVAHRDEPTKSLGDPVRPRVARRRGSLLDSR